jgi:rare lipoprotein A
MRRILSLSFAALLLCGGASAASSPDANTDNPLPTKKPAVRTPKSDLKAKKAKPQVGTASWYGKRFHGRQTASGDTYDMFQFTAASRTLPLGTLVKVTNLRNSKWVIVKVNDRGPYVGKRIMDVSYGAAQMMGFRQRGLERVRLEIVQPENLALAQGVE